MMNNTTRLYQVACTLPVMPDDLYKLHQQVAGLLSKHRAEMGVKRGYQFRVSPYREGAVVVARIHPEWRTNLNEALLPMLAPVECPIATVDREMKFSFRIAPMIRRSGGRVKELRKEELAPDPAACARAILQRNGFDVVELNAGGVIRFPMSKPGHRPVMMPLMDATTIVRVADIEAARAAWVNGIGRHKGFGLGMLLDHKEF